MIATTAIASCGGNQNKTTGAHGMLSQNLQERLEQRQGDGHTQQQQMNLHVFTKSFLT